MIGINSLPVVNHQPEFAAHCATPDADKTLEDGALAMGGRCLFIDEKNELNEYPGQNESALFCPGLGPEPVSQKLDKLKQLTFPWKDHRTL
jgi:hypothetical protein